MGTLIVDNDGADPIGLNVFHMGKSLSKLWIILLKSGHTVDMETRDFTYTFICLCLVPFVVCGSQVNIENKFKETIQTTISQEF